MAPLLATLAAAAALTAVPAGPGTAVRAAIDAALAGARAEVLAVDGAPPPGCAVDRAELPHIPTLSGRTAVHLLGADAARRACDAWAWVRVRVSAPALVTTRDVAAGEPLDGAVAVVEREARSGSPGLWALPEGARAARALPPGVALDPAAIRVGPAPGAPVTVAVRAGALVVEERATAVACARARACALLPSGRRIEGRWHDGRIVVEAP